MSSTILTAAEFREQVRNLVRECAEKEGLTVSELFEAIYRLQPTPRVGITDAITEEEFPGYEQHVERWRAANSRGTKR